MNYGLFFTSYIQSNYQFDFFFHFKQNFRRQCLKSIEMTPIRFSLKKISLNTWRKLVFLLQKGNLLRVYLQQAKIINPFLERRQNLSLFIMKSLVVNSSYQIFQSKKRFFLQKENFFLQQAKLCLASKRLFLLR